MHCIIEWCIIEVTLYFVIKYYVFLSNDIVAFIICLTNFTRYVIKELLTKKAIGRESTSFYAWLKYLRNLCIVEGSLFQHKITILPSKFAMCHAHIRHDPFVSRMETTFRHF